MSTQRDVTRIVRSWLKVEAHESADRVLDAVLDALPATPQRRASWLARRSTHMSTTMRIVLAAAAVAAVAFIGYQLLPNRGGVGSTSTPTASPSASPTPTLAPTPTGTPAGLPPGTHDLWNEGIVMAATIPAPGWYGEPGGGILIKNDDAAAPDGAGMIVFAGQGDLFVYGDPCQWTSTRPETPATTVDEFIAALAAQPTRDASAPTDVTVGGYAGKSVTLHVPMDWPTGGEAFRDCERGEFRSFVAGVDGARYHQDPGQIDEVMAVDVNGELVIIDIAYYAGTPAADIAELRSIVDSIVFE